MDRRDRKRERHRLRRQERQKELRQHKLAVARKPRFRRVPPKDMRGLSAGDWDDYSALNFEAVVPRAVEMYPREPALRRFMRGLHTSDVREAECNLLATIFTNAARTLRSDPPWHWPYAHWTRDERGVTYRLRWRRARSAESSDLGALDHWGLSLPGLDGAPVEVWFVRHAIDRFLERMGMAHPVLRRILADGWMFVFRDEPAEIREIVPLEIAQCDGEPVMRVQIAGEDEPTDIGRFPLRLEGGRAIAKTFLEPWMTGPAPAVNYSDAEREGLRERHVREVLPGVRGRFSRCAYFMEGEDRADVFLERIAREYRGRPCPENSWLQLCEEAPAAWKDGRLAEARTLLDRCLADLPALCRGYHPYLDRVLQAPFGQRLLAGIYTLRAQAYARESIGGLDPDRPAPPEPAEAARLMALGRESLERAFATDPKWRDEYPRTDPDVMRLEGR